MGGIVGSVFGGGADAPATPDYVSLAKEQAKGNLDLAKYTTAANRVNQVTPYGTLKYSQAPSTVDQAGYDKALADYNAQLAKYNASTGGGGHYAVGNGGGWVPDSSGQGEAPVAPDIKNFTTDSNQWTATQELSPEQQIILDQQQKATQGALASANLGIGNVSRAMQQGSVNQSSLPKMVSNVNNQPLQTTLDTSRLNPMQSSVDTSNLPSYGINPGETYSDAIMRRLQPQIQQQKESFDSQMANQGIAPGTAAYDNAYRNFSQGQNDLMTSAIVNGMNTGLAANNQQFGQNATQAGLANTVNQQGYNQLLNSGNFGNAAKSTQFSQGMANANLANQTNQQAFNQAQTNLNNPINMFNALRQGSQVTSPNYVNSANMPNVQGADLTGAAQNTYNAQLGSYNAQNASNNGLLGGLMQLGGTLYSGGAFSDERLKENIKRIGTHDLGIGIYSYNYKDGYDLPKGTQVGVMAQELEPIMPEAVIDTPSGFKAVNYAML